MTEDAFERFRRLRPASPLALLQELHARGVCLTPYPDGTVHYTAPPDALTPTLLAAMRAHKQALHDLVELFEERAAIAEYCGGLSRVEAETLVWEAMQQQEKVCR
jgi:FAD/FMN-containing dehydrogenase